MTAAPPTVLRAAAIAVAATMLTDLTPPAASAATPIPATTPAVTRWAAGEPPPTIPPLHKTFTLAVRASEWSAAGPLLAWQDPHGRAVVRLFVSDATPAALLVAEVATDARPTPLRLTVPLAAIGAATPHAVVLRDLGYRLELFVDGVLVDENWPYGSMLPASGPATIAASAVRRVDLWDRCLSDGELQALSGDPAGLAERERRYLGPDRPFGQYWHPRGFDAHVGDCMPFFHDGRFSLFYLSDRHGHASKWHLGAHQWAHVSTTDLVHWDAHPLAIPITDEAEGSICTGSTFFHDGTYYGFYAVRTNDGSPAQLCAATSDDGIHFVKRPPIATLKAPYSPGPGRDPVVFRDPDGAFRMLVTTELLDPPIAHRGGCLAQLVSADLQHWEQREPFLVPGYGDPPECPDYFQWRGWYYLVFSNGGVARYLMSRQPLGPWFKPAVDLFDGPAARVIKTAAFTGDRRLAAAFLNVGGYGGDVVFRELVQQPDGTLGTTWPAEMVPPAGPPLPLVCEPLTPTASGDARSVTIRADQDLGAASLGVVPADFLLRAHVRPSTGAASFGFRIHAAGRMQGGLDVRFEPTRQKVGLRPADLGPAAENEAMAIYNVAGLDGPFAVELLVRGDIVDLCVDGRRTLISRVPSAESHGLFLFAHNAGVSFDDIQVSALTPDGP